MQQKVKKRKTPVLKLVLSTAVKNHATKLDVVIKKISYVKVGE